MKMVRILKGRTALIAASAIVSSSVLGGAFFSTLGMAEPAFAQAPPPAAAAQQTVPSFRDVVKRVTPAVVNVSTTMKVGGSGAQGESQGQQGQAPGRGGGQWRGGQNPFPEGTPFDEFFRRFFGQDFPGGSGGGGGTPAQEVHALGSGFIIDDQGDVLTNNHVIENASDIVVILNDQTKLKAELVGADPKTDIAVVRVKSDKPLPHVAWGDSDKMEVGDWVLAVGNPYGLGGSVTAGIVSARGRDIQSGPFDDYLQIDAPINRGNSGGPSFNATGEVIGVNTAIFSPNGGSIGIGFAVPSNMAKAVAMQLIQHGSVERGWLGVSIQPVTDDIAESLGLKKAEGALVAGVEPNSPAAKAGVKPGDVILSFADKPVTEMRSLPRLVAEAKAGDKVKMTVWRDGGSKALQAEVAKTPGKQQQVASANPQANQQGSLGVAVATLDPQTRSRYGIPEEVTGVLVVDVKDGSPASEKGIQAGDIITTIGGQKVTSPEDLRNQVRKAVDSGRKAVLLLVNRQGEERFVAVPLRSA